MSSQKIAIETELPQDIYLTLQASGLFREALVQKSLHLLAVYCYQQRLLSLGKAARLAELNRWDFIDLLAEHNVPIINYSDDELAAEFAAVEQLEQTPYLNSAK
jgi:predicted HTH domain antitoxin